MTPLLEARPSDPYLRWMVSEGDAQHVLTAATSVAWVEERPTEIWITALSDDPPVAAELVRILAAKVPVDGVTVPEDAFAFLPPGLQSADHGHWSFWALEAGDLATDPDGAIVLQSDDPRIRPLLVHSPSAYTFPGDTRVARWTGVEERGELLSVAGQIREASGAAHIVSVCTHPDWRGRGLAQAACSKLIVEAFAEGAPAVVLEMYADNEAGRRTYQALGFTEVARFRSGLLR